MAVNVRAVEAGETIGLNDEVEGVVLCFVEQCRVVVNVNRAKKEFRSHVPCVPELTEMALHSSDV